MDGLKTGHTDAGGFGDTVSGKDKAGRRMIVVGNGLKNEKERGEEAERLMDYGFRDFENVTLLHKGQTPAKADVWFGVKPQVALTIDNDLTITLPKTGRIKTR